MTDGAVRLWFVDSRLLIILFGSSYIYTNDINIAQDEIIVFGVKATNHRFPQRYRYVTDYNTGLEYHF